VERAELEALVRAHQDDPQGLADAIVAAVLADEDGYRDDATVIVVVQNSLPERTGDASAGHVV
jgi:serine/threonine protein phosphatase PrpC